jgi:hypothetical protein
MGTNGHEIIECVSVWMGPAISGVVFRARARTSAIMIEHGVGHATLYDVCDGRTWHGDAGQFAEPIRMLRYAAIDMVNLLNAAREHVQALAPVCRHHGRGALPKSIVDIMLDGEEALGCIIEWHHFLCALRLAVVWSQEDPTPLYLLTGGQDPWDYFQDNYAKTPAFNGCRLPAVGPGVDRLQAACLWKWLYDLWEVDSPDET